VIVDEQDRLKVTDFGIARAGASEMTETGSILGTAHYLSPEQAQGRAVTGAADLYSVGVILYEMLAGDLPFQGDSAVSIAVKHLNEAPPPLSALRPDVHPAIEAVVMRALAKEPAERFRDAGEFAAALEAARQAMRRGEDGAGVLPPPAPPPAETFPADESEARGRRWLVIVVVVLGLVLAGLIAFLLLRADTVVVPSVTGRSLPEATAVLEREGLQARAVQVASGAPEGVVVSQEPPAGRLLDGGTAVLLRVSSGPGVTKVPSVRNLPKRRAVQKLNEAGFNVEEEEQSSASVERGLAIRTVPREGEDLERGSRVRLIVSTGPERVTVPSVVGASLDSAEDDLEDAGLDARVERVSSDQPSDRVLAQDPEAGARVEEGSEVAITVSDGPGDDADAADDPISTRTTVPSVVDLAEEEARSQLTQAGLTVEVRDTSGEVGIVQRQRPGSGRSLEIGRTVVIYVGDGS
jgi:serine/threonine-protein kinase